MRLAASGTLSYLTYITTPIDGKWRAKVHPPPPGPTLVHMDTKTNCIYHIDNLPTSVK